ncbi:MAG: hypothetical protein EON55_01235, partial [Alphaproteobacteria bacterium]
MTSPGTGRPRLRHRHPRPRPRSRDVRLRARQRPSSVASIGSHGRTRAGQDRAVGVVTTLLHQHPGQVAVIVNHETTSQLLVARLMGID